MDGIRGPAHRCGVNAVPAGPERRDGPPVQVTASVVGDRPVPARAVPPVVARIGVDPDPVDVTDPPPSAGCAPAYRRTGPGRWPGWTPSWHWRRRPRRSSCAATRSTCFPRPSPGCPGAPCPSSPLSWLPDVPA